MKKIIIMIVTVILLISAGLGIWGYLKAQEIKKQANEIESITADTLNLQTVSQNDEQIRISDWKNLAEKAPIIKSELAGITATSDSLREKLFQFYGTKAEDKYKEVQYLQILSDGQSGLGLKDAQPRSKGQIETVLDEFNKFENHLNQKNISLGPEFSDLLTKVQQEAVSIKSSLTFMHAGMTYSSPSVQISSAGLDKAIDELKQAIAKSLNDQVDLQNNIKNETSEMAKTNWINPLKR